MFGHSPNAQSVSHVLLTWTVSRQTRRQENRRVGAAVSGMKSMKSNGCNIEQRNWVPGLVGQMQQKTPKQADFPWISCMFSLKAETLAAWLSAKSPRSLSNPSLNSCQVQKKAAVDAQICRVWKG